MAEILAKYAEIIEKSLAELLPETDERYANLREAMNYSLSAGGKRIRPALVLGFCEACGGNPESAVNFACALEMIHTYSLIHDDLPCMDNDDYRRGKPSCHKAFGESIALLAGDALQSLAFNIISSADLPADRIVNAVKYMSDLCGINGMVGGQTVDLNSEGQRIDTDTVMLMDKLKTGALIKAGCVLGCISAGAYNMIECAEKYAEYIGLSFQIKDDILDVTGDQSKLGKPIGSDAENNKSTYVSIFGLEKAEKMVADYTNAAVSALEPLGKGSAQLCELAEYLAVRNS